ncbi:aldehyde dehydrogenase (NADP(+)) [Neorhodopirellula lusitana]|uniref:aldehyde dehydrogenase (NADP(+)) n=1 Tax=Neorhodopirellula lusitana TaxID=445327 RepID=UPI00384F639A
MSLVGKSLVGSEFGSGSEGEFKAINPASGETLEPAFGLDGKDAINKATSLAAEAFQSFKLTSGAKRAQLLRTIASGLEANVDAIAQRMQEETALPEGRCRGEMGRTCGQLRMFADLVEEGSWLDARVEHADPDRAPLPKPGTRSMLRPLGPVVVFGASNFPLAFSVAGGDTASALAVGCPVIAKAHLAHPGTSELVGRVIQESVATCGMPEGVFSLLFLPGEQLAQELVQSPEVKAVGFTGSRRGGRAIMDVAAARPEPIPVFAEMSSINPVFITRGAIAARCDAIAQGFAGSLTLGSGQFCTNPGLVVIDNADRDAFVAAIDKYLTKMSCTPMLTPAIADHYRQGLEAFASQDGVTVLGSGAGSDSPNPITPTVFGVSAEKFLANGALSAEIFGPASLVVFCDGASDFLKVAGAIEGQLTATVQYESGELESFTDLVSQLESKAGRLVFNAFPTGVEVGHAMVHGGPYPSTSDGRSTSVGTQAAFRFCRPVCWQDCPDELLPKELQESNPLGITRLVDGKRVI